MASRAGLTPDPGANLTGVSDQHTEGHTGWAPPAPSVGSRMAPLLGQPADTVLVQGARNLTPGSLSTPGCLREPMAEAPSLTPS